MNTKDRMILVLVGFGIWAAATVAYRQVGSIFFERSVMEYLAQRCQHWRAIHAGLCRADAVAAH
ncbi:hypothetical protein [Phormidium tenue]|uniref:hypothetical protein n=1 Tax=Phormidium tenue TaxID=126344 RepID=UPI001F5584C4|nr:hypothetical protein [Phormidium tenue]